jgi:hypothetical protein
VFIEADVDCNAFTLPLKLALSAVCDEVYELNDWVVTKPVPVVIPLIVFCNEADISNMVGIKSVLLKSLTL